MRLQFHFQLLLRHLLLRGTLHHFDHGELSFLGYGQQHLSETLLIHVGHPPSFLPVRFHNNFQLHLLPRGTLLNHFDYCHGQTASGPIPPHNAQWDFNDSIQC
jgi:hypothetical protein